MLLLTPSKLVLLTGGALLATCVFIGALVAVLHWKEKVRLKFFFFNRCKTQKINDASDVKLARDNV